MQNPTASFGPSTYGRSSLEPFETALEDISAGVRVLFVDDNTLSCQIGHRLLSKRGALVQCATSGEEALAIVETADFDLIVLDCMMPGMTGFELARHLRAADSSAATTPLVAVTASGAQHLRTLALESGIDQILCKPLCAESVLEYAKAG